MCQSHQHDGPDKPTECKFCLDVSLSLHNKFWNVMSETKDCLQNILLRVHSSSNKTVTRKADMLQSEQLSSI